MPSSRPGFDDGTHFIVHEAEGRPGAHGPCNVAPEPWRCVCLPPLEGKGEVVDRAQETPKTEDQGGG